MTKQAKLKPLFVKFADYAPKEWEIEIKEYGEEKSRRIVLLLPGNRCLTGESDLIDSGAILFLWDWLSEQGYRITVETYGSSNNDIKLYRRDHDLWVNAGTLSLAFLKAFIGVRTRAQRL